MQTQISPPITMQPGHQALTSSKPSPHFHSVITEIESKIIDFITGNAFFLRIDQPWDYTLANELDKEAIRLLQERFMTKGFDIQILTLTRRIKECLTLENNCIQKSTVVEKRHVIRIPFSQHVSLSNLATQPEMTFNEQMLASTTSQTVSLCIHARLTQTYNRAIKYIQSSITQSAGKRQIYQLVIADFPKIIVAKLAQYLSQNPNIISWNQTTSALIYETSPLTAESYQQNESNDCSEEIISPSIETSPSTDESYRQDESADFSEEISSPPIDEASSLKDKDYSPKRRLNTNEASQPQKRSKQAEKVQPREKLSRKAKQHSSTAMTRGRFTLEEVYNHVSSLE